uniref:Uncharacterized protein n=1 Tax=Variovorax paradoxus (strain S110) TaxID=543728 RepID=C5CLR6_VARPS
MSEVSSRVLAWLDTGGFPLEMKAAAAFRHAGFEVRQSATYADPVTEKGREIDVLANDPDLFGFVDLATVIECKSSPNPWVVLTAKDAMEGYNCLRTRAVFSDRAYLGLTRDAVNSLQVSPLLHAAGRCGYALRQAFSKGNDPGYEAAMAVVSACKGVFPSLAGTGAATVAAAIPIIVVNAPIFECELGLDGKLRLTEVLQSDFIFSARIPKNVSCTIRVVHIDAVDDTARWAKQIVDRLRADLRPEEQRVLAELSKPKVGSSPA